VEINTNDPRFWVATTTDGYYTIAQANTGAPNKVTGGRGALQEPSTELAANNDWVANLDNDPLNRWCLPANTLNQK
jgi:hypothetical protein